MARPGPRATAWLARSPRIVVEWLPASTPIRQQPTPSRPPLADHAGWSGRADLPIPDQTTRARVPWSASTPWLSPPRGGTIAPQPTPVAPPEPPRPARPGGGPTDHPTSPPGRIPTELGLPVALQVGSVVCTGRRLPGPAVLETVGPMNQGESQSHHHAGPAHGTGVCVSREDATERPAMPRGTRRAACCPGIHLLAPGSGGRAN